MAAQGARKARGRIRTPGVAYGYARVSTGRQVKEGQSLGVQQDAIRHYAAMMKLTLADVFTEEGVSGGKPLAGRPEGKRLVQVLAQGDSVIITRLDRAFRDTLNALETIRAWEQAGVTLHVIELGGDTTGAFGKFMIQVIAAVAEMERYKIRERVRDVKAAQKARGRYLGGPVPFGAEKTEDRRIDESGCGALAAQIAAMHGQGLSVRDIARAFTEAGRPVSKTTIHRLITMTAQDAAEVDEP